MIGWIALAARPKGWSMSERYGLVVRTYLRNRSGEGDVDNYAKLVQDALEGIAWVNDRQVDLLLVAKIVGDGEPRTEVEVGELDPVDDLAAKVTFGVR